MKTNTLVLLVLALSTLRADALSRCSGNSPQSMSVTSGQSFMLPLTAVPGALDYEIQRAGSWTTLPRDLWLLKGETMSTTARPATGAAPAVSERLFNSHPELSFSVYYLVTATNAFDSSFQPCAQDFFVTVAPDPSLSRDGTRIVIPVAGSLRGANNSVFRTRVVLQNVWDVKIEGSLVFRKTQGGAQSVLRYSMPTKSSKEFADIVAEMGADGLGTLDIVPDSTSSGYLAPVVTAQLDSLAPGGGVFGTAIPSVSLVDPEFGAVWSSFSRPSFFIGETANTRYNIGIRTLGGAVTISALLFGADGSQKTTVQRSFPPDYHEQIPLSTFLGTTVAPGDSVELIALRQGNLVGGAIVYIASTDNVTNDVRLEVPRPARSSLSQPIVACSSGAGCGLLEGF